MNNTYLTIKKMGIINRMGNWKENTALAIYSYTINSEPVSGNQSEQHIHRKYIWMFCDLVYSQ